MKSKKNNIISELNILITFTFIVAFLIILSIFIKFNIINLVGFAISDTYDDYTLYILNNYEGESVSFVIPIENKGIDIKTAIAEIEILDIEGNEISFLKTDSLSIKANETKELLAKWDDSGLSGDYQVRILILLDGKSYSFSKIFSIEKKIITLESIIINEFKLGEIVNFSILVKNHQDNVLNDVSARILILNDLGNTITEIRSIKENIESKEIKKLKVIWDTKDIESGKYNAKLIVNYGKKFADRDLVLNIQENNLEVIGIGYSISQQPEKDSYTQGILVFLVLILVLANIMWIIFYNRKSKKR